MNEEERKELYKWAWLEWGSTAQVDILIEEMSELIHALLKARRNGVIFNRSVYEEFSDVSICMEQMRTEIELLGLGDTVDVIIEQKLNRLSKRLNGR